MLTASCLESVIKMPEHGERKKKKKRLTNNCCLSNGWKGASSWTEAHGSIKQLDLPCCSSRIFRMAARIIFLSSYSLAARSFTETEKSVKYGTCKQCQHVSCFFFFLLNTILVSSSTSCTDCSFFARMSNFSADSDLKTTVTWS